MASKQKTELPAFTGSTTIGELLTHFGKVEDKKTRTLAVQLTCHSVLSMVTPAAQVSNEDKETALATLTMEEQLVIARYTEACQTAARARKGDAAPVERWAITGEVEKLTLSK